LIIPKFENQLTARPPVYQPTVITNSGFQPKEKKQAGFDKSDEQNNIKSGKNIST
jgi:hypothetical protein